jgi:hypothetical protein
MWKLIICLEQYLADAVRRKGLGSVEYTLSQLAPEAHGNREWGVPVDFGDGHIHSGKKCHIRSHMSSFALSCGDDACMGCFLNPINVRVDASTANPFRQTGLRCVIAGTACTQSVPYPL